MSSSDDLPTDVKKLLDDCIRSLGHLETLLFLHAQRERSFLPSEVALELRTNEAYATLQLGELCPFVIEKDLNGRFRFSAPSQSPIDHTVQKLADFYRERRHTLINYIYSRPPDALKSFADAFRLKKD